MSKATREKKKKKLEELQRHPCRKCKVAALCLVHRPTAVQMCRYCGRRWVTFQRLPGSLYGPDWIELRTCKLRGQEPLPGDKPETPCNQMECTRKCVAEQLAWEEQKKRRDKAAHEQLMEWMKRGPHDAGTNFWAKRKKWGRKPMGKQKET